MQKLGSDFLDKLFFIQKFTSSYGILSEVLIDKDKMVATDGFALALAPLSDKDHGRFSVVKKIKKPKANATGFLNNELTISDGQVIEVNFNTDFPDYWKVFPDDLKLSYISISLHDIDLFLRLIGNDTVVKFVPNFEEKQTSATVFELEDRSIELESRIKLFEGSQLRPETRYPFAFTIRASYLKMAVGNASKSNKENILIGFCDGTSPVIIFANDMKFLVMPISL